MTNKKRGPVLSDGHTRNFQFWLYEDELVKYRERWFSQPHEVPMRMLDWHITQYFMCMQQSVLERFRAVVRTKTSISKSDIKEMIVKFEKDYSKSHDYEYLGIMSPSRNRNFIRNITDYWLKEMTNIKVLDD